MSSDATERSDAAHATLMLSVSGCRGVVGESLTPEVVSRFAGAFAGWTIERRGDANRRAKVVVGRDGRLGGDVVEQTAVAALRAAGCDVINLGVASTPAVGAMTVRHGADGGLVLTASHNPAQWNGLKCLTNEGRAPGAAEAGEIIERFRSGRVALAGHDALGALEGDDTAAHVHVARVLEAVQPIAPIEAIQHRRFRVALDSVNASGRLEGRMLLEALGCDVVHLGAETSGVFPHPPEPIAEHLGELCEAVAREGVDVGFAQDPDADRLAIVDESGRFIGEEYTFALGAEAILGAESMRDRAQGATLAANLSTSRMIDDVARRHNARVVRAPVGEANVVDAIVREGCLLGGEGNGGVIWPDVVLIRDSLVAMALTLTLMTRLEQRVGQIIESWPSYAIEKRKAPIREGLARRAIEALASRYADQRVDTQDGVRIDFEQEASWLHVRASNTEPILRLIAEAPTLDRARRTLDEAESALASL